jgi:hypothetical protein
VDLYDWLLFLHVLAAFLLVAGLVVIFAVLRAAGPSLALLPVAQRLWDVGGIGVLVFGIWLALKVDGYELWDGWILAALILYAIAGGLGGRALREYREAAPAGGALPSRVVPMYAITAVCTLAILVLMIYKPGA